jgi:hypothetical protein
MCTESGPLPSDAARCPDRGLVPRGAEANQRVGDNPAARGVGVIMRTTLLFIAFALMALETACQSGASVASSASQRSDGDIVFRLSLGGFHPAAKPIGDEALEPGSVEDVAGNDQDSLDTASRRGGPALR